MEIGVLLATVLLLALVVATVAGFVAARVLMHAAASRPSHGGGANER
ncbi:MAG TPA: hypothetical protein VIN74_09790 [Candidatus Limnocylindria bacterium]|jgi:hypothetical protein